MKWVMMAVAMMAVMAMTSVTMAKSTSAKVSGVFERMEGETIILSSTKDGAKVETPVVTTKDTKVTIDGTVKTLADLTQGMHVKVKTPNGLATEVIVKTKIKSPTTKPSGS